MTLYPPSMPIRKMFLTIKQIFGNFIDNALTSEKKCLLSDFGKPSGNFVIRPTTFDCYSLQYLQIIGTLSTNNNRGIV